MYKVFNDSVHEHIRLHPLCVKIINTPQFQRLRYIKQLSVADYVYPGACHTRFEHSLGVCYLAGKMMESLKQNKKKFRNNKDKDEDEEELFTDEEKLMVEIAGLCHDLGHGPFSHTWERVVKAWDPESTWSHEEMSGKMLRHLVQENNLEEEFKNCGANIDTIIGFINGEAINLPSDKKFLSEIVSNSGSGVDVDKWDYFLRDSLHLNIHITFDYKRLLSTCTVVKDKDERRIGYRDSTLFDLYEMYNCRAALHYKAYQHRVVKAVELMFIDAFKAAGEDYMVFKSGDREVKLKDAHKDKNIDLYTHMTDHILQHNIQYSTDAKLEKSREILMNVAKRKLYTFLGRKSENLVDEKKLLEEYKKLGEKMCGELGITRVKIDMGKASDPVSNVVFYKKPRGNNTDPKDIIREKINTKLEAFPFQLNEKCPAELLVFCKCGDKTEKKHDFIKKTLQLDEETKEEEIMEMDNVFNGSVDGHITLHPLCVKIINTPEFQRLKDIKLSVADYLYPGRCHTRFEHSLGVCYLAGKMVETLKQNESRLWNRDLNITAKDKLLVEIAGLCHNLGLGPFSYTWHRVIEEWECKTTGENKTTWNHDDMLGRILKYLIKENNLDKEFARHDLNTDTDVETIIGLIQGEAIHLGPEKQFLAEIVKNKKTGVDVNKWDYFLRDSLHLNIPITFDYNRLLSTCTVIREVGGERRHIAYRDNTLIEMYDCEAALYLRHKVVKAVELMFIDAFKEAGDHCIIKNKKRSMKLKNAHDPGNEDMYVLLTDDYIQREIQYSTKEELGKAKTILTEVAKWNLYTYVGRKRVLHRDNVNEEKGIIDEAVRFRWLGLRYCELLISTQEIDTGNESDSLQNVIFYRKPRENECEPVPIKWNQIKRDLETSPFRLRKDRSVDLLVFCRSEFPHPHEEVRRILGLID